MVGTLWSVLRFRFHLQLVYSSLPATSPTLTIFEELCRRILVCLKCLRFADQTLATIQRVR